MAAAKRLSSGVLLERIWCRYQQSWKARFAGATPPSKRAMSERMLADKHALARWTNDKAHQAGRNGWCIPLRRVLDVCAALEATEDERDDLMAARLAEMQGAKDGMDVLVLLHWLEPLMHELSQRPVLDSQQRQVLVALDRARAAVPCWAQTTGGSTVTPQLETSLADWLRQTEAEYLQERKADLPSVGKEDQRVQAQALTALRRIAKARVISPAQPPTEAQTQAVVRSIRSAIRGATQHQPPTTTGSTDGEVA